MAEWDLRVILVILVKLESQALQGFRVRTVPRDKMEQQVRRDQRVRLDPQVFLAIKDPSDPRDQKEFGVTLENRVSVVQRVTMETPETQAHLDYQDLRAHQDKISWMRLSRDIPTKGRLWEEKDCTPASVLTRGRRIKFRASSLRSTSSRNSWTRKLRASELKMAPWNIRRGRVETFNWNILNFRAASTQSIQMKDAAVMLSKFIVILRRMQLV